MENFYLVYLAFLKIFKGLVLTFAVSSVILIVVLQIKDHLHISYFESLYNRFITGGIRK